MHGKVLMTALVRQYGKGAVKTNLHETGDGDLFSSVCVPAGCTLRAYEHINFEGARLVIKGPREILDLKQDRPSGRDSGDKISSLRVDN